MFSSGEEDFKKNRHFHFITNMATTRSPATGVINFTIVFIPSWDLSFYEQFDSSMPGKEKTIFKETKHFHCMT